MPSIEDILVTFLGRDEVSPVAQSMASNTQSALSSMESNAISGANNIGQAYQSTFDTITMGIHSLNSAMMGLSSVNRTVMGELGSAKSAMEYVYGTTSAEDTNKVLMQTWGDAQTSYEDLYKTVDSVTDNSLTSMQDLIPAMNAFKASTEATGTVLKENVAENMAQFGAYVLALTGSEQLAKTAMTDLSKGLVGKGSFNAVDQYGVTKASLMANGWSGDNSDIAGYMEAVRKVTGAVEDLMDTNAGLDARLGKMWSRAGKRIGREMMPGLKSLKLAFMDLDDELDGNLSTSLLRVSLLIEEASRKAYILNTLWDAFRNITQAVRMAGSILGIFNTVQDANNLAVQQNTRDLEANTLALQGNMDMRLANSEVMALQNLGMEGYNPYSDVAGYGADSMMEDSWGGDVLANTMGGIVESKYDRLRYGNLEGELAKNRSGDRGVRQTSPVELLQLIEGNEELSNVEKELLEREVYVQQISKKLNATSITEEAIRDEVNKIFNNPSKELYPKSKNNVLQELIRSQGHENVMNYLARYEHEQKAIKTDLKGLYKAEESLMDTSVNLGMYGTSFMNNINHQIAGKESRLDVKKVDEIVEGPFRRLSNYLTGKKRIDLPDISGTFQKNGENFGKKIYKSNMDLFKGIGNSLKGIKDLKGETKIDTLDNIWDGFKGLGSKLKGGKAIEEVAEGGADIVKGAETVASVGQGAGAVAPAMVEAEGGLTLLGLSEMGLVGAFTTLIVPTLAIAGVIAILIPIVAGLAIEAMYFLKIVQQFLMSMNFGDVDMTSAIDGLTQLGTALGWLAIAMASLSVAGLLTGIATMMTGFGQVEVVLGQAVDMLKKVITALNGFATGTQLTPGVAEQISAVGDAINSISMALLSLVGTQLVSNIGALITGFGHLGSLSDTFERAKNDIQSAIKSINSMTFEGVDESKVGQLKVVLDAISSFADAFKGLQDIRTSGGIGDLVSWVLSGGIFGDGGVTVQEAFQSAHDDIKMATEALQGYGDIGSVDESIANNLTNVGNAIKGVADSINNMRTIRDAYNWDEWLGGIFKGKSIQGAFQSAKADLEAVATELKDLGGSIAEVPTDLGDKITNISTVLSNVSTAIDTMKNVAKTSGGTTSDTATGQTTADTKLDGFVKTIRTAKDKLIEVSKELKSLNGGGENEEGLADVTGLDTKITNLTNSLTGILGTIDTLTNISTKTVGGGTLGAITETISQTKTALVTIAGHLRDLNGEGENGLGSIPTELDGKITSVGTALSSISNVATALISFPFIDPISTGFKIENAVKTFKKASEELKRINEDDRVGDIQGIIDSVTNALNGLKTTINGMNFSGEGRHIAQTLTNGFGQLNLQPTLSNKLSVAVNGSRAYAMGKQMATYLNNGFSTGLNLVNAFNTEVDNLLETANQRSSDIASVLAGNNTTSNGNDTGMGGEHMGVDSIGRYSQMLHNNEIDTSRLHTMSTMGSSSNTVSNQTNPTHIVISEGAVQVDANNLTKREARQVLINGLEGLSSIKSIQTY